MTEILFYHLTESKLEDALPPLLEKSLERGWKVAIQTVGEERRDFLDTHLWTFRDDSFLPHATDTSPAPQNQPILLTASDENANAASVRFLVDGATASDLSSYERAIFLFDGNDPDAVDVARDQWKEAQGEGFTTIYWQQDADGRWQKKA